jgi:predicted HAD superfamily phosphohydrolase
MDLPYLIKFINSKLNLKSPTSKELRAEIVCMSAIRGFDAKYIFGDFFGSNSVFRYTNKMKPIISLSASPFGDYISKLQFDDLGVPNETRITALNEILSNLNYRQFINMPELDFSDIENIKF